MATPVTKKIIVMFTGLITELNDVYGPILSPFLCDLDVIRAMVSGGRKVYEILNDGTSVLLTIDNYANDNGEPTPTPNAPPYTAETFKTHLSEQFDSESGVHHELRFFEGHFEYYDNEDDTWKEVVDTSILSGLPDLYAAKNHNHDGVYSPVDHNHDELYMSINEPVARKYTQVVHSDDAPIPNIDIVHGLNSIDIIVSITSPIAYYITTIDENSIHVDFEEPLTTEQTARVLIIG
jgi:hypothetical protein